MPLSQLLKKIKLFLYFGNDIAAIAFFFIYFKSTPHSDTQDSAEKLGSEISAMPLPKFKDFLSPPFLILSPAFWLNFGNAIAEIQSLSLISQLSLNSSYNAN